MKRTLLFVALWIATAFPALAATRVIPVAGHLPGAGSTSWTTDVSLRNNSSTATSVELVFHADSGLTRTRSVTLGAGASALLEDAVAPTLYPGSNPPAWLGQLEIRAAGDVTASAHTFTPGKDGGTYGSTYEGVDPAVLSTSGAIAGLVSGPRFRSNMAFTNPTADAISVQYALRRADGSVAASRTLDLGPYVTRQLSLAQDVAAAGDRVRYSLFWSATGRAYAVGSILDNDSGDPTSAPSVSRSATSLFYPIVGRTAGNNATFWSTSASIAGTTGAAGSVTFAYTETGTNRTYTRTVLLPALGSISTDDVNDFVGAGAGTGSLRVSSTTPLAGVVRVFNTLPGGATFGSAILPQDDVVRSTSVSIDGVRRDGDYRLNVTIANDDRPAAEGRIRLLDEHGVEVESHGFRVEGGTAGQIALGGAGAVRAGTLRVETSNGVAVTAIASNVDNVTGDTIQRESEQESERQNELEIAMSTRTAAIGLPIAFSLRNAPSGVAAVSWDFGDGSRATGAAVTHAYTTAGEHVVTVEVTLPGGAIVRDREDVRIAGGAVSPVASPIDFTFTPAAPAPGQQVTFTATGATAGGVFQWRFPGNIRPVGNTVTFTFPSAGNFEVEVEIEHGATTAEVTRIVPVGGAPSTTPGTGAIDFTFSPQAPLPGQEVTFTATGNTGGGTFKWNFPGNVRKSGSTATFTFPTNGSFEVEVEVEHGTAVAQITKIVNVGGATTNNPGTGSIDFSFSPSAPAIGQLVTFTATGNTGGGTFKWKFPGNVRKLGNAVTFAFPTAGSHEVEVEVEHGTVIAEVTKVVTVGGNAGGSNPGGSNPGPATFDFAFSPAAPAAGQAVTFTASGSTAGTFQWKFPGNVRKSGSVVTFTFAAAGSYEVELEIEHGATSDVVRKTVTVSGSGSPAPNPNPGTGGALGFSWSPSPPRAGQPVTFTASGNTGGGSYKWRFPGNARPTGAVVTFTFAAAGSYEVEVEIEHGSTTGEVTRVVTVVP